jgi:Transcriptional regulator, AbiEi antitoxin
MRQKVANADVEVARIAARQHGVVSQEQLINAGLGTSAISRRVQKGRLHRIHRGVYAVGHPGISDSYAYHRGRIAFQKDRARDLDLRRRGFDVIRISERQLNDDPGEVAAVVAQALGRAS